MKICEEGRIDARLYTPEVPIGEVFSYNTNPKKYYLKAKHDNVECVVDLASGTVYTDMAIFNSVTIIQGCFKRNAQV